MFTVALSATETLIGLPLLTLLILGIPFFLAYGMGYLMWVKEKDREPDALQHSIGFTIIVCLIWGFLFAEVEILKEEIEESIRRNPANAEFFESQEEAESGTSGTALHSEIFLQNER